MRGSQQGMADNTSLSGTPAWHTHQVQQSNALFVLPSDEHPLAAFTAARLLLLLL